MTIFPCGFHKHLFSPWLKGGSDKGAIFHKQQHPGNTFYLLRISNTLVLLFFHKSPEIQLQPSGTELTHRKISASGPSEPTKVILDTVVQRSTSEVSAGSPITSCPITHMIICVLTTNHNQEEKAWESFLGKHQHTNPSKGSFNLVLLPSTLGKHLIQIRSSGQY